MALRVSDYEVIDTQITSRVIISRVQVKVELLSASTASNVCGEVFFTLIDDSSLLS